QRNRMAAARRESPDTEIESPDRYGTGNDHRACRFEFPHDSRPGQYRFLRHRTADETARRNREARIHDWRPDTVSWDQPDGQTANADRPGRSEWKRQDNVPPAA